jgi:hypothetical protein
MGTDMTVGLKIALGAAGVGLIGGVVAERLTSGDSINRSRDADRWNALHDDFLNEHPAPAGTRVFVNSEPAWKNAALVAGAGIGVALLGGAAMFGAHKMSPQNYPLFVAGLSAALLGGGAAAGAGASWAVR